MPRLHGDPMPRIEASTDRVLDVVETLETQRRWPRIIDQLCGSGTSIGANMSEADEAMSVGDF